MKIILVLMLVQLHGDSSRADLSMILPQKRVIYVLHTDENGNLLNFVSNEESSPVDWILVDSAEGGRSETQNKHLSHLHSLISMHLYSHGIDNRQLHLHYVSLMLYVTDIYELFHD